MLNNKQVNIVRVAGLISAVSAAIATYFTSGDYITAAGLIGAAFGTFGGKQN